MARKPITSAVDLQEHVADKQAAYAGSFTFEGRSEDVRPVASPPPVLRTEGGEMQVLNQSSPDGLPAIDPAQLSRPAIVTRNALDRNFRAEGAKAAPAPPGSRVAELEAELQRLNARMLASKAPEDVLSTKAEYDRVAEMLVEAREEQARLDEENKPRTRYFRVLNKEPVRIGGTVVIRPGKIVDTLNFKMSALQQNGVRLEEVEAEKVDVFIPDNNEDRMSGLN